MHTFEPFLSLASHFDHLLMRERISRDPGLASAIWEAGSLGDARGGQAPVPQTWQNLGKLADSVATRPSPRIFSKPKGGFSGTPGDIEGLYLKASRPRQPACSGSRPHIIRNEGAAEETPSHVSTEMSRPHHSSLRVQQG